ncbi:hypothetical protein HGRIS_006796 [Hohenbuehelia grisea]|uniref:Alpha/beta hydrolase fold-3 domain-containing protein n=1 Tax=Hohenbuehelia grisea TaxID=104357 RepID=A0ABR3JAF1_9AGAR
MPIPGRYAQLSWFDAITLPYHILKLPFTLLTTLLASPFVAHNKHKPWRRVLADRFFRYVAGLSIPQGQKLIGTTEDVYLKTMSHLGLSPVIEDLGHDAKLLWIGPKRTDRVLLYLHGGAYFLPPVEAALQCWRYVQNKLKSQANGVDVGVAVLKYTLLPEAGFPTPLRQTVLAIEHLLASGLHPSGLQLTGDSAGGNLIIQALLHALHPVDGVPPLKLPAPIRGAYTISPWVSLAGEGGSHLENSHADMISAQNLQFWGALVLVDVPVAQRGYVEAVHAPEAWFDGMERVVERVLITAGGAECLRDDIVRFGEMLKKHHPKVDLVVQNRGVHNDMFMDFLAGLPEDQLGELTPMFIQWFAEGYKA